MFYVEFDNKCFEFDTEDEAFEYAEMIEETEQIPVYISFKGSWKDLKKIKNLEVWTC